ncbi:MAG TPA: hypothetical protein VMQ81_07060 [Acidimicrobiia bacterium]|nr:hypothetical protein [Acidimicrobiia bacterium]
MRHRPLRLRGSRRAVTVGRVALAALASALLLGCGGDGGDQEAFCATATQLGDQRLLDPEVTRAELDRLATVYQQLDDTAPADIGDDVELLNDAVQKLREGDISFVADEERALELAEAFEELTDYVRDECP